MPEASNHANSLTQTLDVARRALLDLGLRNPLLNYRPLKARGVEVLHILGANKIEPHPYTSAARIVNGELSYKANDLLR